MTLKNYEVAFSKFYVVDGSNNPGTSIVKLTPVSFSLDQG